MSVYALTFVAFVAFVTVFPAACASSARTSEPPQQKQLAAALTPPKRLAPPESLPGVAREILRARMVSHTQDMGALMSAIMVLEYDEIQTRAQAIAGDANLARPLTGDATELNSLLPAKFFDLQDALKRQAGILADAARRTDALGVANAYGALSETCVQCHATYRAGR